LRYAGGHLHRCDGIIHPILTEHLPSRNIEKVGDLVMKLPTLIFQKFRPPKAAFGTIASDRMSDWYQIEYWHAICL